MNEKKTTSNERIYSLDTLRAVMMLLGIVLHAGISYATGDYKEFWPIKDTNPHIGFDVIVAIIHHFRMPVFFVVAGFFAALLYYKKGPATMLKNRARRILLPFLAAVLLIYPLAIFAFDYSKNAISRVADPFSEAWSKFLNGGFLPFKPLHLWFLYFLVFYSIGTWALAQLFRKETQFTIAINGLFKRVLGHFWIRLLVVGLLILLCFFWIGEPYLTTNNKWAIDLPIFFTYFIFFNIGWTIQKSDSLARLGGHPVKQLMGATFLFFALIFIPWEESASQLIAREMISAFVCTLYVFGFLALFLKYFNQYSPRLNYMMEASYWVYLVHLPIVAFFPGLLAKSTLPTVGRFLICLLATILISLLLYQLLVRYTLIGKFLSGKKQTTIRKSNSPIPQKLM